jgi:hypothetical protein
MDTFLTFLTAIPVHNIVIKDKQFHYFIAVYLKKASCTTDASLVTA